MRTKVPNEHAPVKTKGSQPKNQERKSPETSQTQPNPAKKPGTRIPPPQSARIVSRFIAGQSIREISREEGRDRATITRIVRCEDVQLYILRIRENYLDLGPDAINALQKNLKSGKDGRLARQVLDDIGAIPGPRERDSRLSGKSESGNTVLDDHKKFRESIIEVLRNKAQKRTRK